MEDSTEKNKDQMIASKMYLAILISLVLTLAPTMSMAIVSTIFLTGLLIAAYVIRGKVEEDGLAHHHMRYIIRSAWIGSLYAMLLTGFSSAYMIATIDYSPIDPCAQNMARAGMGIGGSEIVIMEMALPCIDTFLAVNKQSLTITALITAIPVLLFFFVRFGRGFVAARQGQVVKQPLSWV